MARQWDKWCTAFALAMAALLAGPAPANAAVVKSVASAPAGGPRVIGWALNGPQVLAAVGNTVFVGNSAGYLTEIDARTGAYIKTIDGHNSAYDLTNPCAMAVSGPYLYVANCPGGEGDMASGPLGPNLTQYGTVDQIDAETGAVARILGTPSDHIGDTSDLVVTNHYLIVASTISEQSYASDYVIQLSLRTGKLVHRIRTAPYTPQPTQALAATNSDLFVATEGPYGSWVNEYSLTTGHKVETAATAYGSGVLQLLAHGQYVYATISGTGGGSVLVLSAINDRKLRSYGGAGYHFGAMGSGLMDIYGRDLLVLNDSGGPWRTAAVTSIALGTMKPVQWYHDTNSQSYPYRIDNGGSVSNMISVGDRVFIASPGAGADGADIITMFDPRSTRPSSVYIIEDFTNRLGLHNPQGMAVAGDHLCIISSWTIPGDVPQFNVNDGAMTVLDPTTGKLQRLVSGMSGNKFAYPSQIVSNGKLVFVLNLGQYDDYAEVEYNDPVDSVDPSSGKIVKSYYAEYDSTIAVSGSRLFQAYEDDSASNEQHPAGVWSDVVANGRTAWFASTTNYAWYNPTGMIVVGRYLFVADTGRVTQLVSRTGAMVRELAQIPHIPFTDVMASTEGYLFVANIDHSVSQINVASGERVRVIPSSEGNLEPTAMAAHGGNVYIVNANDTVTEIDPGTGALVRQFAGPAYGFSSPSSIAFFQNTMEILNTANISVTIVPGVR